MRVLTVIAALAATPAMAAGDKPYGLLNPSLYNSDYVVLIGFLLFIAILFYAGVPGIIGRLLDQRAATIRAELDEARALREEAQTLLASYERKQREVADQSAKIVAAAKADAEAAAKKAKADLEVSIARRLQAAEDQIASAEDKAVRAVRDQAVDVAIAAAADVIGKSMATADANALIDGSIDEVGKRLH